MKPGSQSSLSSLSGSLIRSIKTERRWLAVVLVWISFLCTTPTGWTHSEGGSQRLQHGPKVGQFHFRERTQTWFFSETKGLIGLPPVEVLFTARTKPPTLEPPGLQSLFVQIQADPLPDGALLVRAYDFVSDPFHAWLRKEQARWRELPYPGARASLLLRHLHGNPENLDLSHLRQVLFEKAGPVGQVLFDLHSVDLHLAAVEITSTSEDQGQNTFSAALEVALLTESLEQALTVFDHWREDSQISISPTPLLEVHPLYKILPSWPSPGFIPRQIRCHSLLIGRPQNDIE